MKHIWSNIEGYVVYPTLNQRRLTKMISCERCGYHKEMKYVLPDESLKAIGIPDCDDYIIASVMKD
jgi:hypothetical protein